MNDSDFPLFKMAKKSLAGEQVPTLSSSETTSKEEGTGSVETQEDNSVGGSSEDLSKPMMETEGKEKPEALVEASVRNAKLLPPVEEEPLSELESQAAEPLAVSREGSPPALGASKAVGR